jgi:hypothetical protein
MKKSRVIFLGVILLLFVVAVIVIIANINKASIKGYNLCYDDAYKEAMNNLDVSLCELVGSVNYPYYDNYCRELCISNVAYESGNPELCELISPVKGISHVDGFDDPRESGSQIDYCYFNLARKLENNALCDNVETEFARTKLCPIAYKENED